MVFKILFINANENTYDRSKYAEVVVEMNAKEFAHWKKKGELGTLYGIAISNEVHRITGGLVRAYNPTVGDRDRASKGVKRIRLTYEIPEKNHKALGIEGTSYSNLYHHAKAVLRIVS